jgi:hypothetical protein
VSNSIATDFIPSEEQVLAAWAAAVHQNNEQAERFCEKPEEKDFYAPTAANFKPSASLAHDPIFNYVCGLMKSDNILLDIGAGGGRYALPLACQLREVIAVEPSAKMRSVMTEGIQDQNIHNISIIDARWPCSPLPRSDVAFISHVGYDIADIGPFVQAMEKSAKRLCIAVMREGSPATAAEPFWPLIHHETRAPLPSLKEFLQLLLSLGRLFETKLFPQSRAEYVDREMLIAFLRQQLFIQPNGEKDQKLKGLIDQLTVRKNGRYSLPTPPGMVGVVSWSPPPRKA